MEIKQPKGFGRIRLRRVVDKSAQSILAFVHESVVVGSIVRTDGSWAYKTLAEHGYLHERTVMVGAEDAAHFTMPGVHRVASLLKRWLLGTHHGVIKPKHMDAYFNQFTFRFNRRTSRARGLLFYRLLEQAVVTNPVTYADITNKS